MDQLLDIDEVCSKTVGFEKLLWIARKKGWEDETPRCRNFFWSEMYEIPFSGSKYKIDELAKLRWPTRGYWKNRLEEGWEEWSHERRSLETKDWLIDQARIRHIKKNYYTTYSIGSSDDLNVQNKWATNLFLWIVLGFPICLFCGFLLSAGVSNQLLDRATILDFEGELALAGYFFGFMLWFVALIALFLKEDSEFELEDLQCIMLEYLDEIGMRPEGARELTQEEVRRIRKERQKRAMDLYKWKCKMQDYLYQLRMEEFSVKQSTFVRDRIGKELWAIEDVGDMDEQWISERVKRMNEEVFSNEW